MLYLVIMETVGSAPGDPVQHLENIVLPNFEALMEMEADKRILAGGSLVGRRGTTFIVDVPSNEELSRLLHSLPLWGFQDIEIIPLQSFEDRALQDREMLKRRKKAL